MGMLRTVRGSKSRLCACTMAVVNCLCLVQVARPNVGCCVAHAAGARSTVVVRTVRLPAPPYQVVVDAPTRRVFVLTAQPQGGATITSMRVAARMLDGTTGAPIRAVALEAHGFVNNGVVDARTGRLFVLTGRSGRDNGQLTGPGTVHVIDGRTGGVIRVFGAGLSPQAMALDARRGRLFILDWGRLGANNAPVGASAVRAVDEVSGAVVWTARLGQIGGYVALDARTDHLFVTDGDGVTTLDARTGKPVRHVSLPDGQTAGQTGLAVDATAGRVVASLYDSTTRTYSVALLDATTGRVLRTIYDVGPGVVDPRVGRYIATESPLSSSGGVISVTGLDTRSGRIAWTGDVNAVRTGFPPVAEAVDTARGRVVIVSADVTISGPTIYGRDYVSAFDTRTGHRRAGLNVGVGPPAVGVDEQTARIFVANAGDNTVSVLDAARL